MRYLNDGGSMSKVHQLKIRPEYFQAVINGTKKAEFRRADRDYDVGDTLCLHEYGECEHAPHLFGFTGEIVNVRVIHITDVSEWAPGYVMLSIRRCAAGKE